MFFYFCVATPFTGGDDRISSIPRRPLFGVIPLFDDRVVYCAILAIFVAVSAFVYRIVRQSCRGAWMRPADVARHPYCGCSFSPGRAHRVFTMRPVPEAVM